MSDKVNQPTKQVSDWLAAFGAALDRGDAAAASSMFGDESYWRDLVSFTWNIKTLEGKNEIGAMLVATLPAAKPGQWQLAGDATEDAGVVQGWFTFETAVARGKGHIRLKSGKCWTLL